MMTFFRYLFLIVSLTLAALWATAIYIEFSSPERCTVILNKSLPDCESKWEWYDRNTQRYYCSDSSPDMSKDGILVIKHP